MTAVATTTTDAIRDRTIVLIESIVPTTLAADRFRRHRNEADFFAWALANPAGAFRRFRVRGTGYDGTPDVNNASVVERRLVLEIAVAYPQNSRTGRDNALDRDDAQDQDWRAIDYVVGVTGAGNFSSSADCTPLGLDDPTWERSEKVDFAVFKARFMFWAQQG